MQTTAARALAPSRFARETNSLASERFQPDARRADEIARLEAEIVHLKEQVAQLSGEAAADALMRVFGLSRAEAFVIAILAEAYPRTVARPLIAELYDGRMCAERGPREPVEINTITAHLSRAARKLKGKTARRVYVDAPRGGQFVALSRAMALILAQRLPLKQMRGLNGLKALVSAGAAR